MKNGSDFHHGIEPTFNVGDYIIHKTNEEDAVFEVKAVGKYVGECIVWTRDRNFVDDEVKLATQAEILASKLTSKGSFTESTGGGHLSLCPYCSKADGPLNVGAGHYFVCHEHKKAWKVGVNLFSSWREESLDVHRRNSALLKTYDRVDRS
jgi:hypothetical protein